MPGPQHVVPPPVAFHLGHFGRHHPPRFHSALGSTTSCLPDGGEPRALDAIISEGTLTIGWVGPALLGILIAAFGCAGRVFEWLGTLATWLFSGEWREGIEPLKH